MGITIQHRFRLKPRFRDLTGQPFQRFRSNLSRSRSRSPPNHNTRRSICLTRSKYHQNQVSHLWKTQVNCIIIIRSALITGHRPQTIRLVTLWIVSSARICSQGSWQGVIRTQIGKGNTRFKSINVARCFWRRSQPRCSRHVAIGESSSSINWTLLLEEKNSLVGRRISTRYQRITYTKIPKFLGPTSARTKPLDHLSPLNFLMVPETLLLCLTTCRDLNPLKKLTRFQPERFSGKNPRSFPVAPSPKRQNQISKSLLCLRVASNPLFLGDRWSTWSSSSKHPRTLTYTWFNNRRMEKTAPMNPPFTYTTRPLKPSKIISRNMKSRNLRVSTIINRIIWKPILTTNRPGSNLNLPSKKRRRQASPLTSIEKERWLIYWYLVWRSSQKLSATWTTQLVGTRPSRM